MKERIANARVLVFLRAVVCVCVFIKAKRTRGIYFGRHSSRLTETAKGLTRILAFLFERSRMLGLVFFPVKCTPVYI